MGKWMRKIHLWLSIPFGVVILVMCLAGALLCFENELSGQAMSIRNPSVRQEQRQEQARKSHHRDTTAAVHGDVQKGANSLQPHSANRPAKPKRTPFFMAVFKLHRWLLIDSPKEVTFSWGRLITGATAIAFLVILVSGLFLWWPMARSRGGLPSLRVRTGQGAFPLIYSLHITLGVLAVAFLLMMATTGLYWTFSIGELLDKRMMLQLHTGRWGGYTTRILYCLSALSGAFLAVSGYWLWLRKRIRRRTSKR